jgi:flavin-dependent dehydrogenase
LIAGASFSGLAVAREVGARALLVDPQPVGDGQTSACAAPVSVLDALGTRASIQQGHDELVLHMPGREVRWGLPEPYCTFDYRRCCLDAHAGARTPVLRGSVQDRHGNAVLTSQGEVRADILIDCTGWRAALAEPDGARAAARLRGRLPRSFPFGLEAEVQAGFRPGLHFYFWPEIVRDGYAWVFPAGETVRVGLLSYCGRTRLGPALDRFLRRLGIPPGPRHGGFLRVDLHPPVVDGVFVVGDAGGQCLPLTGEGIRTAVWAGRACGRLVRGVLDGSIGLAEAAARYRALVHRQRRRYRALFWAAVAVLILPPRALGPLAAWVGQPGPLYAFMRHYLGIFAEARRDPDLGVIAPLET